MILALSCCTHLSKRNGIEHVVQQPMLADFSLTLAWHVMQVVYDEMTSTPITSTSRNTMGLSVSLSDDSVAAAVMLLSVVIVAFLEADNFLLLQKVLTMRLVKE